LAVSVGKSGMQAWVISDKCHPHTGFHPANRLVVPGRVAMRHSASRQRVKENLMVGDSTGRKTVMTLTSMNTPEVQP